MGDKASAASSKSLRRPRVRAAIGAAAVLGFTGVSLGAFGAHMLKDHLASTATKSLPCPRVRATIGAAAILGFTGVTLGAFGAHMLKDHLASTGQTAVWNTAVQYHLLHAVGVLTLALYGDATKRNFDKDQSRAYDATVGLFSLGVALFSGSLYWLALGGPWWLGPITPIGGMCMLVGWGMTFFAVQPKK